VSCLIVIRQRSFFRSKLAWRQERFAAASSLPARGSQTKVLAPYLIAPHVHLNPVLVMLPPTI
jgi:hypothetical protein